MKTHEINFILIKPAKARNHKEFDLSNGIIKPVRFVSMKDNHMVAAQPQEQHPPQMTIEAYFAFEEASETRHEYVNGRVYAMTGASWNHTVITGNTQAHLHAQLRGKPCTSIPNEMKLKVDSKSVSFRYPDLMVVCGDPQFFENRKDTISNPTVIIEVLSPSTALKDRNEKLEEYIKIDSLQEYVLISQHEAKVERFKRDASDEWLYKPVKGLENSLELPSIACVMELSALYEEIEFDKQDSDRQ